MKWNYDIVNEGMENGEKRGEKRGIEKGAFRAKKEMALSMAEEGMEFNKIARLIKVSEKDVRKWINENLCTTKK